MAPYVRYYTEILEQCGISYDIISWNRLGVEETGVQAFNLKSCVTKSSFGKMLDYFRYHRFVQSKLVKGNYDKVVVFTIVITLMLLPFLKRRYRNKYVFDIRDCSVALKYCRPRFSAAIKNAAFVVISSAGFKHWLPKDKAYLIRHNATDFKPLEMQAKIEEQTAYKILTIGAIRCDDANRTLVEQLANSPMFELGFVGAGSADKPLRDFVARHKIKNVSFGGRYAKQDEPKLLEGAALINILLDDDLNSTTLMSNRFYLSVVHGIPMIVDENTEQARWASKHDLGVVIGRKTGIEEQIIRYLQTFDREKFDTGRRACLRVFQQDVEEFQAEFRAFVLL